MHDSLEKYGGNADMFVKYRPHYPITLLDLCEKLFDMRDSHVIADIGGGTGFSGEIFIKNGNTVYGIEPNEKLRVASKEYYEIHPNFIPINGKPEATNIPDDSVDFLIVGQAFHWFNHRAFEKEVHRILKKHGYLLILWNTRTSQTEFDMAYENLCQKFGTDYIEINQMTTPAANLLDVMQEVRLENTQVLDLQALVGRFMSSLNAPRQGDELYQVCLAELDNLFNAHQVEGRVMLNYNTEIYYLQV